MNRKMALIAFAGVAAAAAVAEAQTLTTLILNDGLYRYAEGGLTATANRTGTGGGLSANFGLANTAATASLVISDYLYQNWWWYRSQGDTREFALTNQTFGMQLGANSAFLRYVEPIGGSSTNGTLTFEFTYTLNQITPTSAAVTINWSIINNSQSAQDVSFFAYSDSDVLSSSSNDGTYNTNPGVNFYRNNASTSNSSQFFTMGADLRLNDHWTIGGFSSSRLGLADASVTTLPDIDTLGAAGDNAAAFEFDFSRIAAGATVGGRITKGYNYVPVPTPGTLALMGLGGLAVARRRR